MVTSEPNSGSVGESPTPVDTVLEPGGGEDPPRPPRLLLTGTQAFRPQFPDVIPQPRSLAQARDWGWAP